MRTIPMPARPAPRRRAARLAALGLLSCSLSLPAAGGAPQRTVAALDAELQRIVALLPGRYVGVAPDPAQPAAGPQPLYHRIAPLAAPRFGTLVFYHEITRDGFQSRQPRQQKIYAFDVRPGRRRNSMRSWTVEFGRSIPAPDRDAATLAALDPAQLKSYGPGCELRWRAGTAADEYIAEVQPADCSFPSDAFRQTVRPAMRYDVGPRSFTLREVIYGADMRPLFPDGGPLVARRWRPMDEVLAASAPSDWRPADPARTLYMDLPGGRVVMELAPAFAPNTVANLLTLVRQRYFDGLAITRVQDNFVVQWGDPTTRRPLGDAAARIAPEFTRRWDDGLGVTLLPDRDGYARDIGFVDGLAVAGDRARGEIWPAHCYGALGVGRDLAADTGNGSELYVVIGQAPRQLERNITVIGRVLAGMELLSALPRGTGSLGFYENAGQHVPIARLRLAADLPAAERERIEVLRTDTATFMDLVEARRNRYDDFYFRPAGHIDLCAVPLPVRRSPEASRATG